MTKEIDISLEPIEKEPVALRCAMMSKLMKMAPKVDEETFEKNLNRVAEYSNLKHKKPLYKSIGIVWRQDEKAFEVFVEGKYPLPQKSLETISVSVAKESYCSCGSVLEIGDFSLVAQENDFEFKGVFFCPVCREKKLAKKNGFRALIEGFITNLQKIEIKATGITIEKKSK